MTSDDISRLRTELKLSRAQLGRFLGVAEVSVVRWESPTGTAPRGLHASLLSALSDAVSRVGATRVRPVTLHASTDPLGAIKTIVELARGIDG